MFTNKTSALKAGRALSFLASIRYLPVNENLK